MNPAAPKEMSTHLRARLRDQHLRLQAAGPGPWPEDLVTATLNDTVALLNLQQKCATQAAERRRAERARMIRRVAQAGSALLGAEAVAALTGLFATGWLTAFGLMLVVALGIWGSEERLPSRRQGSRLTAAALVDFAALWTGVVAGTRVGFEWVLPALGLAIVGVITWFGPGGPVTSATEKEERR
jgi:hypothetical protein